MDHRDPAKRSFHGIDRVDPLSEIGILLPGGRQQTLKRRGEPLRNRALSMGTSNDRGASLKPNRGGCGLFAPGSILFARVARNPLPGRCVLVSCGPCIPMNMRLKMYLQIVLRACLILTGITGCGG